MLCSISGEHTTEPVLSLKSHRIFDAKLLTEYVKINGKDPVSGEPMSDDDIVSIEDEANTKTVRTRKSNQDSIPSMLAMFQNEWDALSLELFELRNQVAELKKELSVSLYRQDAAIKVATRAIKEKDKARSALQELAEKISGGGDVSVENADAADNTEGADEEDAGAEENGADSMDQDTKVDQEIDYKQMLGSAQQELFHLHKSHKFKLPASCQGGALGSTIIKKVPGTGLYLYSYRNGRLAVVYKNQLVTYTVTPDAVKKVRTVKIAKRDYDSIRRVEWLAEDPPTPIVAFEKKVCSIQSSKLHLLVKGSNIQGIVSHPTLPLFVVVLPDSYSLYYRDQAVFESVKFDVPLGSAAAIHPDGLLLALVTTDRVVHIFDLVKGEQALEIAPPEDVAEDHLDYLTFATNGYWLAASYNSGLVKIYDLRKAQFVNSIKFTQSGLLHFDPSCRLLVCSGFYSFYEKKSRIWTDPAAESEPLSANVEFVGQVDDNYRVLELGNSVQLAEIATKPL